MRRRRWTLEIIPVHVDLPPEEETVLVWSESYQNWLRGWWKRIEMPSEPEPEPEMVMVDELEQKPKRRRSRKETPPPAIMAQWYSDIGIIGPVFDIEGLEPGNSNVSFWATLPYDPR